MNATGSAQCQAITAVIYNDPEYDGVAHVERRRWRVALSNGRRKFTRTRREAIEFCDEQGIAYTITARPE